MEKVPVTIEDTEDFPIIPDEEVYIKFEGPIDFNVDAFDALGGQWEYVGDCMTCGNRLFNCVSKQVLGAEAVGEHVVTYLAEGGLTCIGHDPHKKHRLEGMPKVVKAVEL